MFRDPIASAPESSDNYDPSSPLEFPTNPTFWGCLGEIKEGKHELSLNHMPLPWHGTQLGIKADKPDSHSETYSL